MSILFVLLMFLMVMSLSNFRTRSEGLARPAATAATQAPRMQREYGFSIPQDYSFHPGHTWVPAKAARRRESAWTALPRTCWARSIASRWQA